MTPLRYSELTFEDLAILKLMAALGKAYPETLGKPGSPDTILAGWEAWRERRKAAA